MAFFGFFSKKEKPPEHSSFATSIFHVLGFYPTNEDFYKDALVHRSVIRNRKELSNNERLEFLGDSVIDLVVAEWLMEQFKNEPEGVLTQLRAKIVNRKNLNDCSIKMGLDKLIKTDGKIKLRNTSIPGNCLEAVIGAVYLDVNLKKASEVIQKVILGHIDAEDLISNTTNFKSRLLEWSQQEKKQIEFVISEIFESEKKLFEAEVVIGGESISKAIGKNKKEASQKASKHAVESLSIS
ncbi:ribonuclease III [Salibacteraceae bacterium]|nr:ribonuclease III [Salibacteraceae bacterium]